MIVTTQMHTGEESRTVACDGSGCDNVLDPGERWADDAPWNDAQAVRAAEARGWYVDVLDVGNDRCPGCIIHAPDGIMRADGWPVRYHQ